MSSTLEYVDGPTFGGSAEYGDTDAEIITEALAAVGEKAVDTSLKLVVGTGLAGETVGEVQGRTFSSGLPPKI